ncbi:MAG: DoxX family protein [Pseudomonadales bacterium]|nr:DoxX family protein [Pseudomonadales bacterium]
MNRFIPLIGRTLIAFIFIMSGVNKIGGWEQTAGYMASKGMPAAFIFLAGAVIFEILGGLSVLLGYKAKLGALALILFTVPASIIFHNFWAFEGMQQQTQMIMFMKNLAIIGGLLLVTGFGSGPLSMDNLKQKN